MSDKHIDRFINDSLSWSAHESSLLDEGFGEVLLTLLSEKPSLVHASLQDAQSVFTLLYQASISQDQEPKWLWVTDKTYLVYYFLRRGCVPLGVASACMIKYIMTAPTGAFDVDTPDFIHALKYYSACTLAGHFLGGLIPRAINSSQLQIILGLNLFIFTNSYRCQPSHNIASMSAS